jgi:hypothetical protein
LLREQWGRAQRERQCTQGQKRFRRCHHNPPRNLLGLLCSVANAWPRIGRGILVFFDDSPALV